MRLLIALLRDGLPLSPMANRAVAATLLDWRFERAAAVTPLERIGVLVSYWIALSRAIVCSAFLEFPRESVSLFFLRVCGAVTVMIATRMLMAPVPLLIADVPSSAIALYRLTWAVPTVVAWLPVLVFVVEVAGRRTRRGPAMGGLVGVALLLLAGVLMLDAADTYRAWADRDLFAAQSCFAASSVDLSSSANCITGLDITATGAGGTSWIRSLNIWISLTLMAGCLAILGRRIREASSVFGWTVGLAPLLTVVVGLPIVVMSVPFRTFILIKFAWLPEYWLTGAFAASVMWAAMSVRRRTSQVI